MSKKKAVSTRNAPQPAGPYSQAIVSNGFLFTAGFGPHDPVSGMIPEDIVAQTRQVLRNIEAVIVEAGAGMGDVIKTTVHLQNLKRDFQAFNTTYGEFFHEPFPVRTTVGSELNDMLVEIDVTVALPNP